ncbi:(2Fe-2S) ferredoxin domain-containing protein [Nordella sp. HKS 07]|uniref:(2Fe-2S) ferredoxin domain-containing protein n=1 Tax=Nordella sp. HKS 07 TaxID=2712222 RepID=UPI0013E169D9|nr:(2Fe-2S) ferredoxin domain-containing protein [Nordella sp. HKS 07]QIG51281.1 (2Fe-2S) ferredoxin domain-containing protein [Nordella sp. HKS 07]
MQPDAILYLVSQAYVSAKRLRALKAGLLQASAVPARVARMEGAEAGPMTALDELVHDGASAILVQPVGLPFSDSLGAWLGGALGHWLRKNPAIQLALAQDQADAAEVHAAVAARALSKADAARLITTDEAELNNPGWQDPPPFRHHLLVCSGPRCSYREAGSIKDVLTDALRREGIYDNCLIALTGCLFPCNQGPLVAVYPSGHWYRLTKPADVARFAAALASNTFVPELIIHEVKHHEIV